MALHIKKTVYDEKGRIIEELNGTEAEIESYERKRSKKQESANVEKRKKDILLGQAAIEQIRAIVREMIEAHRLADPHGNTTYHYHWYRDNGWWWRPYWTGITWTYQYTNQDPTLHPSQTFCSFNSMDEMSSHLGHGKGYVESCITGVPYHGICTNVDDNTSALKSLIGDGNYSTLAGAGLYLTGSAEANACGQLLSSTTTCVPPVTSGIVDLNMKS